MNLDILGRVRLILLDANGRVEAIRWSTNFLTELGEAYLADRLSDRNEADGPIDHMAIGTSTGQTRTSTTLANEVARVPLDGTYPQQGTAGDDNDVIWQATFGASIPATDQTISEGALFSQLTVGTMINYFEIQPATFKPTTLTVIVQHFWTVGAS